MTEKEFSLVLELARCGLTNTNPTYAFLNQLRRLESSLESPEAEKISDLLKWYYAGRAPAPMQIALNL